MMPTPPMRRLGSLGLISSRSRKQPGPMAEASPTSSSKAPDQVLVNVNRPPSGWDVYNDHYNKISALMRFVGARAAGFPDAEKLAELTPGGSVLAISNHAPATPVAPSQPDQSGQAPDSKRTDKPTGRSWWPWIVALVLAIIAGVALWYALRPGVWTRYTWDGQRWIPGESIPGKAWREPKE